MSNENSLGVSQQQCSSQLCHFRVWKNPNKSVIYPSVDALEYTHYLCKRLNHAHSAHHTANAPSSLTLPVPCFTYADCSLRALAVCYAPTVLSISGSQSFLNSSESCIWHSLGCFNVTIGQSNNSLSTYTKSLQNPFYAHMNPT